MLTSTSKYMYRYPPRMKDKKRHHEAAPAIGEPAPHPLAFVCVCEQEAGWLFHQRRF